MKKSNEWKAIFNAMSDAVCLLNKRHIIQHCNKAMAALFQLPEDKILGKYCWEIVHGIDGNYPDCPVLIMEKTLCRESQDMVINGKWFQVTADPILDKKGKLSQTVHSVRDITTQKQAEEELRRAADRFQAMIDTAPYGAHLYELMPDGRLIFAGANKSADKIFGFSNSLFIGQTIEEAFPNLSQTGIPEAFRQVAASGKPFNIEQVAYSDERWISGTAEVCAFQTAPNKMAALFRDVKERQKMLETLQQTQKLDSLGVLAGGIAHDFNNLLGGIFGFIDLARLDQNLDGQTSAYLDSAMSALSRARGLTQQLLTFSKGGAPVRKLGSLEKTVKESSHFALSGSNVTFRCSIDPEVRACEFDENQISQVVHNIVLNAQQAMPLGGAINICIQNHRLNAGEHHFLHEGDYIRLSFTDWGIGIPREMIGRIFDPFFTTKQNGRGLGLAIAYSIVRKHHGCIDVESEIGKGSTFHVYLPAPLQIKATDETPEQKEYLAGSGRILVIDDEEFIRVMVSTMLASYGYETICVNNGKEALERIAQERTAGKTIDAILCDLTIPGGIGGKELVSVIRKTDTTIPVIVSSGYSEDPVMARPKDFGFSGSLAKPYTVQELGFLLRAVLRKN